MLLNSLHEALTDPELSFLIFSSIASTLICATYVPGAYKTLKSKDTRGISLAMYIFCVIACLTGVVAGIIGMSDKGGSNGIAIVLSNSFVAICASLVLGKKVQHILEAKKRGITEYQYVTELIEKKNKSTSIKDDKPKI